MAKLATIVRCFLSLALVALAWRAGEIGPWTSLILFLLFVNSEMVTLVFVVHRKRMERMETMIQTVASVTISRKIRVSADTRFAPEVSAIFQKAVEHVQRRGFGADGGGDA